MIDEDRIKGLLRKHGDPLTLHHWYFDDCPEDQRRACFYYEYLREAQREGRIKLADWEAAIKRNIFTNHDPEKVNSWLAAEERLRQTIRLPLDTFDWVRLLIAAPWPRKPWLDLRSDERTRRTGRSEGGFLRIEFPVSKLGFRGIADMMVVQPWEVWGWFRFHDGASVDKLIARFTTEIKKFAKANPDRFEEREEKKRGPLTRLRQLGARRLRGLKQYFERFGEKFTNDDVIAYSIVKKPDREYAFSYKRPSELISAAKDADRVLDALVQK